MVSQITNTSITVWTCQPGGLHSSTHPYCIKCNVSRADMRHRVHRRYRNPSPPPQKKKMCLRIIRPWSYLYHSVSELTPVSHQQYRGIYPSRPVRPSVRPVPSIPSITITITSRICRMGMRNVRCAMCIVMRMSVCLIVFGLYST